MDLTLSPEGRREMENCTNLIMDAEDCIRKMRIKKPVIYRNLSWREDGSGNFWRVYVGRYPILAMPHNERISHVTQLSGLIRAAMASRAHTNALQ
jgi:hypothetical protein